MTRHRRKRRAFPSPIRITPFRKGVANRRLQQRLPLFYGFLPHFAQSSPPVGRFFAFLEGFERQQRVEQRPRLRELPPRLPEADALQALFRREGDFARSERASSNQTACSRRILSK